MVRDEDVAYHAGEGRMPDGRTGINGFSVGIEHVQGHAGVAPDRKTDPWHVDRERVGGRR